MIEMEEHPRSILPVHACIINGINLPFLLLCPQKGTEKKILCLGATEDNIGLLQGLFKYFTVVSSCSFENVPHAIDRFPSNIEAKQLDEDSSILPYDSNLFDVTIVCNYPTTRQLLPDFFSEIYRILQPDGCLFFCFSNSYSCQRIKQLLRFSSMIKEKEVARTSFSQSVLFYKKSLRRLGFVFPHFYTFTPGCTKLSEIRDCNKIAHSTYLNRPFVSLKKYCIQFLKNSWLVRDYFATHYGVIAGKQGNGETIPSLIAREMALDFQETSWQVWGDKFKVTEKGTFVFKLYNSNEQKAAICKIPLNPATRRHLQENCSALAYIHANRNIPVEVQNKIPFVIKQSEINGNFYFVEELKEGIPAVQYRYDKNTYDDILYESSKLITKIHNSTLSFDEDFYTKIINKKIELLRPIISSDNEFIIELEMFLLNSLRNNNSFVLSKGDCSANNIIVNSGKEISGIIDWDQSQRISFPMVDIINLIESFRRNFENISMGEILIHCFFDGKRSDYEDTILKEYCSNFSLSEGSILPFTVLYWIDHIIAQDFSSVCQDKKWMQNNVFLVINYLKKYF